MGCGKGTRYGCDDSRNAQYLGLFDNHVGGLALAVRMADSKEEEKTIIMGVLPPRKVTKAKGRCAALSSRFSIIHFGRTWISHAITALALPR